MRSIGSGLLSIGPERLALKLTWSKQIDTIDNAEHLLIID